jgi:hypothetical protein
VSLKSISLDHRLKNGQNFRFRHRFCTV